jgi:hypothetical protein
MNMNFIGAFLLIGLLTRRISRPWIDIQSNKFAPAKISPLPSPIPVHKPVHNRFAVIQTSPDSAAYVELLHF